MWERIAEMLDDLIRQMQAKGLIVIGKSGCDFATALKRYLEGQRIQNYTRPLDSGDGRWWQTYLKARRN